MPDGPEIVRTHGPMVWKTVWRLVGTGGRDCDAADCFQEVFIAALEVAKKEPVRNWEAMLRHIATSKGLDMLRARIRGRKREAAGVDWESLGSEADPPDAGLLREEQAVALKEALSRLRAEEAELFCLRHLEEMSYEEIGMHLRMTPGAIGVALHRTKEKLRGLMNAGRVSSRREVSDE